MRKKEKIMEKLNDLVICASDAYEYMKMCKSDFYEEDAAAFDEALAELHIVINEELQ
jgi:hypothetical protein